MHPLRWNSSAAATSECRRRLRRNRAPRAHGRARRRGRGDSRWPTSRPVPTPDGIRRLYQALHAGAFSPPSRRNRLRRVVHPRTDRPLDHRASARFRPRFPEVLRALAHLHGARGRRLKHPAARHGIHQLGSRLARGPRECRGCKANHPKRRSVPAATFSKFSVPRRCRCRIGHPNREPEPRACLLRGEEWIEESCPCFRRNLGPGILHLHDHHRLRPPLQRESILAHAQGDLSLSPSMLSAALRTNYRHLQELIQCPLNGLRLRRFRCRQSSRHASPAPARAASPIPAVVPWRHFRFRRLARAGENRKSLTIRSRRWICRSITSISLPPRDSFPSDSRSRYVRHLDRRQRIANSWR